MRKKIILLALFLIFCTITQAQYASWMMGTWKSRSETITPYGSVASTIQIKDVSVESFTGIKTREINNGLHAKIVISISGAFKGKGLYLQDGEVVNKQEPENGQWYDCSACTQVNKMMISRDSLILINSISDCNDRCNGETVYYKLLSEYDDDTQRYLVDRFGRPSDIIGFRPYTQQKDETIASNDDNDSLQNDVATNATVTDVKELQHTNDSIADAIKKEKRHQDSLENIAGIKQQQKDNAASLALQKKRKQEITDSLDLVKHKEQQHNKDSLDNVAKLQKIKLRTEDSLRDAQAKKRQQEIADSLNLAQQKEQQRIKDSLDNVARLKQQQIEDSTQLAQQKKREQVIDDSLSLAKQKEQQRIKDSLDNVARLEKIRTQTEDSLRNVQAKQRQQEVADSLSLANQKKLQLIKDSLQNVAAVNLQKQRTADSLNEVQASKRQQEITDSLAAVRKQHYNDSLQKAALAKAVAKPATDTVPSANTALTSRTNVLLQTYHITSPDILIELFDNGEIDGDRVSVFHNNEIIVSNQTLGIKPITLNIHADSAHREHEFVLVAENLGSIPPNSALMRITAGKQVYKLSVNTDMKTNAKIVFYYDGN
ncbi:MAG: hypothetical protein ABJB05_06040 [Parafilimonas sp.]